MGDDQKGFKQRLSTFFFFFVFLYANNLFLGSIYIVRYGEVIVGSDDKNRPK